MSEDTNYQITVRAPAKHKEPVAYLQELMSFVNDNCAATQVAYKSAEKLPEEKRESAIAEALKKVTPLDWSISDDEFLPEKKVIKGYTSRNENSWRRGAGRTLPDDLNRVLKQFPDARITVKWDNEYNNMGKMQSVEGQMENDGGW